MLTDREKITCNILRIPTIRAVIQPDMKPRASCHFIFFLSIIIIYSSFFTLISPVIYIQISKKSHTRNHFHSLKVLEPIMDTHSSLTPPKEYKKKKKVGSKKVVIFRATLTIFLYFLICFLNFRVVLNKFL